MKILLFIVGMLAIPAIGWTSGQAVAPTADMTGSMYGILGVVIFVLAYSLVPFENTIHLRKSKPVLLAAGVIWILVALANMQILGDTHSAHNAIKDSLVEYAELFLFLLAAMTYINAMEERNVFQTLRAFLVSRGFSLRLIFWVTGLLAFVISPIADNLTTALLMGAVVMAVGGDNIKFVALACINVVVAANAGGAFSPFGDITTLMVWQKGHVAFHEFFSIFLPSLVNWLVPAAIMSLTIGKDKPKIFDEQVTLKYGAYGIVGLFLATIITAVSFHNFLHLPPAAGMMLGLGFLGIFSYHIKVYEGRAEHFDNMLGARSQDTANTLRNIIQSNQSLDKLIERSTEAVFAIDTEHRVTHWSSAMEDITGMPAGEAIGSTDYWRKFYKTKKMVLADHVLNYMPEQMIEVQYKGHYRRNPHIAGAYDVSGFFEDMGEKGKWLTFSAAPLKDKEGKVLGAVEVLEDFTDKRAEVKHFDIMQKIARAEWDTLMFFYGVILCVGGLAQFGYLNTLSLFAYQDLGPTVANIMVGILSAIVDNIPVMFAVLTMSPEMSHGQWLLVTLTAGVGGSMLSIGSAAGVALMGTARGKYTFGAHLKWTPVIILGYAASILCHLWINVGLM
jgi:Na+/H+ antiporter NhaD/arsenite permease-like protein